MNSSYPINVRRLGHLRFKAFEESSKLSFRTNEVDCGHKMIGIENLTYVWTHLFSKVCEDTNYLSSLLILKFSYLVIGFHDLGRLNINRSTCRTLIMNNTRNLTFQAWCDRNNQSSVTQRRRDILLNQSFSLCST